MVNPNRPGINFVGARRKFTAVVTGAQPGTLIIPITTTRAAQYTSSGATDSGSDLSRQYTEFAIQSTPANSKDVTLQVSVDGVTWQACPTEFLSPNATATIIAGTGALLFANPPCAGAAFRLSVAQPVVATDFVITVLMSNTHARYDPKRT